MLNNIKKFLRAIYLETFLKRRYLCSIKHINTSTQEVVFICRGTGVLITMFIDKIIDSYDLISNFIPEESALLGYYFGQFFYNHQNKTKHSLNSFDFTKI